MTDVRHNRGHSRKLKIGVGGQPVQSWQNEIELQPTSSLGKVTSAQNTDSNLVDGMRHPVAQGTASKQGFTTVNTRARKEAAAFPVFHSKNAPMKVSVTGEWALKECEDFTSWANHLLKRGKRRTISDIRRSIGDGQTLVHILEILAGQKIPGVYARPVTRAQKLENLQLCMSFMGNRNIDLQGIYVGDLIDGNVKSVLSLCRNVKSQFKGEGWVSPDGPRPSSSGSNKEGSVPYLPSTNGYDVDPRTHGSSSGYHSDEASPTTQKNEPSPIHDFRMPGMLEGQESPILSRKPVQPSDVIITTRTELDKRGVLQTARNLSPSQMRANGAIPLEDRLRSLLSSPNPGGLPGEETEEEMLIPPPPKLQPFRDEDDVERRLQSLLDVAEEDQPGMESKPKDLSSMKELDRIGYVPSHPSQKMRNVQKGRGQARTSSFTGNAKPARGAKLPAAPQNRRSRVDSNSPSVSPSPRGKLAAAVSAEGIASRTQISASQKPTRESRSGSTHSEKTHTRKLIKGEGTPPRRFQRSSSSRSDFLQQVADKLADRSTTSTAISESETPSPARTPMLPTLSPASSVATYVFMSSSDSSSGLSSYEDEGSRLRRRSKSYSGSGTPASRRERGKAKNSQDLQSIRKQLETLEEMYSEILVEVGSKDSRNSTEKNSQRTADIRGSLAAYKKQRNKDIKAVNKRFSRLESHVVTLARSVAHLSSELRSQASISQDMDDMRRQVNAQQYKPEEDSDPAKESAMLQSRVKKLRSFFGEDPPLLAIFLKKLGYERFADNFEAEQVGILEMSYMTEERLQSLGIPLGPRLRIMEEVKKLSSHLASV